MKKILLLFVLSLPLKAWSQVTVFWHSSFQLPISLGDFRETSDPTLGAGARFQFYLRPTPTSPLQAGIDLGVFGRGQAVETVRLNIAGFEDDYRIRASNGVGNFGLMLKLEPFSNKRISPYIEGAVGTNVFYSTVNFRRENRNSEAINVGRTAETKGRAAIYYGSSAGLKIALGKKQVCGIDLKCAYFKGGKTDYNDKPYFSQAEVVFERRRSRTDMLVPQIGFWVIFGKTNKTVKTQSNERFGTSG
jgi:hypothetical protein